MEPRTPPPSPNLLGVRKSWLEKALFASILGLWLVGVGLSIRAGSLYSPFYSAFDTTPSRASDKALLVVDSAAGPGHPPRVRHAAPGSPLQAGDELLAVAGTPLVGLSQTAVLRLLTDAALEAPGHAFQVEFARQGERGTTQGQRATLAYRAHPFWWLEPLVSSIFMLTTAIFFFRVRDRGLALRSVGLLGASAIYLTGSFWGGGAASDLWSLYRTIVVASLYFFAVRFALFFPYRRPAGRPIEWALPILFGASNLSTALINRFPVAVLPEGVVSAVSTATGPLWAAVILWSITYNYLHAKPSERRQIKWLLLGMYVTFVPWLFGFLVYVGFAEAGPWRPFADSAADAMHLFQAVATVLMAAIPIGAMISVFYYRAIDVDPVLSRASSLTIVGVGLVGFALYALPLLTRALHANTGFAEDGLRFGLVAAVMGVAIPTNRALRSRIDHFLRPEFDDNQAAFQDLLFRLGTTRDVRELTAVCGREIETIFAPSTLAVYARVGESFELIFGSGRGIPSTFLSDSPLVATLRERKTPISLHSSGSQTSSEPLSAFDRASLETLGATVVVPIRLADELPAFFCLGEKENGDIYLPQELSQLGVLANTVSAHLGRLDQQSLAENAATMRDDLKRYVPSAISSQIEAGRDLESRESAVSVLFVDIRGYSTLSEGLESEAVFTLINAYTQVVSGAVDAEGGCVVEFNGDGLMAVFGAPLALPQKEAAAIRAGHQILQGVSELAEQTGPSRKPVRVGVGIATGAAYVGSVQSTDRLIWTALGDTTNLAARLESMTRELDADMVIDQGTYRAAGAVASGMELQSQVSVRGRAKREDVYLGSAERLVVAA